MADRIFNTFTRVGEQSIVTYDWYDHFANVGYKRFYAAGTQEGVFLTTQTFYSGTWSDAITSNYDKDFDITFKMQQDVEGRMIVVIPMELHNNSGGTLTISGDLTLRVRKYSGTTETEIANTTYSYSQSLGAQAHSYEPRAFSIIIPKTHYKAGDVFRFTILLTTSSNRFLLYYSPLDQTATGMDTTKLTLDVPFNIID